MATSTIASLITGVGRSAVAVIAIRGEAAESLLEKCFVAASNGAYSPGQIRYGQWAGAGNDDRPSESVVVTPIEKGHFEIHCHGGSAPAQRIVDDLVFSGAGVVGPSQFLLQSGSSLLVSEAVEVLSRCVTARTAAIAMDQVRGALQYWVTESLRRLASDESTRQSIIGDAQTMMNQADFTIRLTQPFRVVLVGPPNVGKSSLINAIVGYDRSITMDVAGTTRDVLHADTVIDGLPIRLSDTAGIRISDEPIEREGIARARAEAVNADLAILVGEPGVPVDRDIEAPRYLEVLNKVDRIAPETNATANSATNFNEAVDPNVVRTIATMGIGIETLMQRISQTLTQSMPGPGAPVVLNERQLEMVSAIARANPTCEIRGLLERLTQHLPQTDPIEHD